MANGMFGGGLGTIADPFLIEDARDLNMIRSFPSKNFKLVRDINLVEPPFNKGWNPIPSFSGTIDGDYHSVYNMYINTDEDNAAFISKAIWNYQIAKPMFKNISFEKLEVRGRTSVASIIGTLTSNIYGHTYTNNGIYNVFYGVNVQGDLYGAKIGGLICNILEYPNNAWHNEFSRDTKTNLVLHPIGNGSTACMAFNNIVSSRGDNYFYLINTLLFGKIETDTYESPNYNIVGKYNNRYVYTNVYYESDNWKTVQAGVTGLNDKDKMGADGYSAIQTSLDSNGNSYWSFSNNSTPVLSYTIKDNFIVKANNKYYTFNEDNSSLDIVSDVLPDIEEVKTNGIKNIYSVNTKAWAKAQNNLGKLTLINVQPNNVIYSIQENDLNMNKSNAKDYKQYYSTTYTFDDYEFTIKNKGVEK